MPSGMAHSDASAFGTASASAWPPGSPWLQPNTAAVPRSQAVTQPRRQGPHSAQPTTPDTSTRSPLLKRRTSLPTSTTSPIASWPTVKPPSGLRWPW